MENIIAVIMLIIIVVILCIFLYNYLINWFEKMFNYIDYLTEKFINITNSSISNCNS